MTESSTASWQRFISRATGDPFFLGAALALFKSSRGVNDEELADWLACSPGGLERLSLCRLPHQDERLAQEVKLIADFTGCNPDRLVALVREVAALGALREGGGEATNGFLMAARDRKTGPTDEDDGE